MVVIYDTTLRDGEQMPGVVFSKNEKIELAKKSSEFGSGIIDLMPAISEIEREVAEYLASYGLEAQIIAATMLRKEHVDIAKNCGLKRIILFTPVSDTHLDRKLGISRRENLEKSLECVDYAKEQGLVVDFAGEDSTRADISYLVEFINTLGDRVDYFLPCDTLGFLTPQQTYRFVRRLKRETDSRIGLHIHNDFGCATANTLAGIEAGADLFSGTFNGIGERAGNAPIEEVVLALRHQYGIKLSVNYEMIWEICSLVEECSGIGLQKHKPISGENAFSHESGIHVDGILKYPPNYENFDPRAIGRERRIIFGKHSGIKGLKHLFGNRFSDREYQEILGMIKSKSQRERRAFFEDEVRAMFAESGVVI